MTVLPLNKPDLNVKSGKWNTDDFIRRKDFMKHQQSFGSKAVIGSLEQQSPLKVWTLELQSPIITAHQDWNTDQAANQDVHLQVLPSADAAAIRLHALHSEDGASLKAQVVISI